MRVNVYAEEMTPRVELVTKKTDEGEFVGVRFYLELPASPDPSDPSKNVSGPFIHRVGDDDSSAVTFWGKRATRAALVQAITLIDHHYLKEGSKSVAA